VIQIYRSFSSMLPGIKRVKIGSYGMYATGIIVLALLLRIVLTALGWPPTNSDESTMGLMALHIASFKDFPVFMYGQLYMGAIEAYLAAVLFHIFGVSLFSLRLGTMLLFTLFLTSMYLLAGLLYTKKIALITLALLSLGSTMMVFTELMAHGGYPEILCFGTVAFLLASRLALSSDQNPAPLRLRRMVAFSCWGFVVAVGFWSNFSMLSIILMCGLLLVLFCWRELLRGAIWPLLLGLAIGSIPLIIYNVQAPPSQNSFAILLALQGRYKSLAALSPVYSHFPLLSQIWGTVLFSLPMATGAPPLCFDSGWVLSGIGGSILPYKCFDTLSNRGLVVIALYWSTGFIVLWFISVFYEFRVLWKLRQQLRGQAWSPIKRRTLTHHFARLALLASAALVLLQYALSPVSAVYPTYGRYLTGLLIATPALIAPLWGLSHDRAPQSEREGPAAIKVVLRRAFLLLIWVVYLIGTIGIFFEVSSVQVVDRQQQVLIYDLLSINVTHFYTDYWTCDRLAFLAKEQIICAVLDGTLHEGGNRVKGYDAIVKSDPHHVYMFPLGSEQDHTLAALAPGRYWRFVFEGYAVYQPVTYAP
jgi:hypothetical protein